VKMCGKLEKLKDGYHEAWAHFSKLKVKDVDLLTRERERLNKEIQKLTSELEEERKVDTFLEGQSVKAKSVLEDMEDVQTEISKIEKEYGNEKKMQKAIEEIELAIEEKKKQIAYQGAYSNILTSSVEYVRDFKPDKCPVCNSSIDFDKVVSSLKKEIEKIETAKVLEKLRAAVKKAMEEKERHRDALKVLDESNRKLKRLEPRIEEIKKNVKDAIRRATKEPLIDFIDKEAEAIKKEAKRLEGGIRDLEKKSSGIEGEIRDVKKTVMELEEDERDAQKELDTKEKGERLLSLLEKKIEEIQADVIRCEELSSEFESVEGKTEKFDDVLSFLTEKTEVEKLEKELPELQKRVKELEQKHKKLEALAVGLSDIHQALSSEQKTVVGQTLSSLQPTIGSYFTKILGHPYYVNLQIVPEEEKGKYVYWIKAFSKDLADSTYISTRFSGAQMNAAAISVFLSMAEKLPHKLGLIVLDDPTQSMDPPHKQALAFIIAEHAREKQIILATPDDSLKTQVEKKFPETKVYDFKGWSQEEGPQIEQQ